MMCQKCEQLINKYYPDLSQEEQWSILMGATCFPFCGPDGLEPQLIELIENTDGSVEQACAFAQKKLDDAVAELIEKP